VVKVIVLLARQDGMSRRVFERYLHDRRAPLVVGLPGLRRLVVNRVPSDQNGPPPGSDAAAEDWFEDAANLLDMTRLRVPVVEAKEVSLARPTARRGGTRRVGGRRQRPQRRVRTSIAGWIGKTHPGSRAGIPGRAWARHHRGGTPPRWWGGNGSHRWRRDASPSRPSVLARRTAER
jgi:hypothetical protein